MITYMKNLLTTFLIVISLISCDKKETLIEDYSFVLESKFDSIRSCPGGGGLFILRLQNTKNQTDSINLQLKYDDKLNAALTKNQILIDRTVFEVLIEPEGDISVSDFQIIIKGKRNVYSDSLILHVETFDWNDPEELGEIANTKKTEFVNWLNINYPEINIDNQMEWDVYSTYPQTIIVEHYTMLNDDYEIRICIHAMQPPDDWAMIRLRGRNTFDAFLAAKQDSTNGPIYQIPIEEYPLLYGY